MNSLYTPLELASQLGDLISALTSQVTPFRSLRDLVADDGLVSLLHQELQSISDKIASQPAPTSRQDAADVTSLTEDLRSLEVLETQQKQLEEQIIPTKAGA